MSRPWLPHPAVSRRPRFASVWLAAAALMHGSAPTGLTATACELCGGAHHTPAA